MEIALPVFRLDFDVAQRCIIVENAEEEFVIDFVPPHKASVETITYNPRSLPCLIRESHAWEMPPFDERRCNPKHSFLRSDKITGTGVKLRCPHLPNQKTDGWIHPKIMQKENVSAELPEELRDYNTPEDNAKIHCNTMVEGGCKLSYRLK